MTNKTTSKPFTILVTGAPATGKTVLAPRIADALKLPLIQRDGMKEVLFESLGWKDREWSKNLGGACWDLLWYVMEAQLKAGASFVVDAHFETGRHLARFQQWQKRFPFHPIQIYLKTEHEVRFERYHKRATSGERHPGHVDHLANYDVFLATESERDYSPLPLGGTVVEVDTTDFATVDYAALIEEVRSATA